MKIARVSRLDEDFGLSRGGVATIGVFDGVHLGHRRILERLVQVAGEESAPAIVLTFAVHPVVVLRGLPTRLITSLHHRLRLFQSASIDECAVLPFDAEISRIPAESFCQQVFVEALALRGLVVGPDARVGAGRGGDVAFLRSFCDRAGIRFEAADDYRFAEARVSSTRIRAAIADGDLVRARRMLGRDWSLLGTVVKGVGRGRKLGFATANLDLHHEIRPPPGVYAVRVQVGEGEHPGVVNIGIRPTFGPDGDLTVEVHLLEYDGDLYGQDLEVFLVKRIRDEMQFSGRDALIRQIQKDVETAREILL